MTNIFDKLQQLDVAVVKAFNERYLSLLIDKKNLSSKDERNEYLGKLQLRRELIEYLADLLTGHLINS